MLTGFRTSLEQTKVTIVALVVLHNIAIELKEREFPIEQEIEEDELEPLDFPVNLRGAAERAVFIQNNF